MHKTMCVLLAVGAATIGADRAAANTITISQTLVTGPWLGSQGVYSPEFGPTYLGYPSQVLSPGDSLDWTLTFPNAVTFSGLAAIGVALGQLVPGHGDARATGSVSLLDGSGNVLLAGTDHTVVNNTLVAFYSSPSYPIPVGDVTISGIHAVIRFDGLFNWSVPLPPDTHFAQPYIYTYVADGAFGGPPVPAPSPEPSTWALTLLGFGCLGAALRTRRGANLARNGHLGESLPNDG